MERDLRRAVVCLAVPACLGLPACSGTGSWVVETWGEDYIEREIPAEAFADGCTVFYDTFLVSMAQRQLLDGDGDVVGALDPARVYDLTAPGPVAMGTVDVAADHYSHVRLVVAPDPDAEADTADAADLDALLDAGASVLVDGVIGCDGDQAHFRWTFDAETTYDCEPPDLTIPAGGEDDTQLTIHGDHLWYDGLENADAGLRGREKLDADADGDGEITLDELDAVSIPALGYEVGEYGDVATLRDFLSHLTQTLGHIDGEGECRVSL
jgi:hypothetical protein